MSSEEKTPDVEDLQERLETLEDRAVLRDELNNEEASSTRRDALKAGGVLGLGLLGGGGAAYGVSEAVGTAEASHDNGGTVSTVSHIKGYNGNPVEFSTGLDADEVSIGQRFDPMWSDTLYYEYAGGTGSDSIYAGGQASGGSVSYEEVRTNLQTDGTIDAYIIVEDPVFQSWNFPYWDNERALRQSIYPSAVSEVIFCGMGRGNANNVTQGNHVGIKIEAGDLYATVCDDTARTNQLLRSAVSAKEQYEIKCHYTGWDYSDPTATVEVTQWPNNDGPANWTESYTFRDSDGVGLPQMQDTQNSQRVAWQGMIDSPNGVAVNLHMNWARFVQHKSAGTFSKPP